MYFCISFSNHMQEFILTLVVIFVLFKVFGRPTVINFNQHHHQKPDGKINVSSSKSKNKHANDEGEYVDYEEIK